MKTFKSLIAALLVASSTVFAHGEHKPGPHGGEIRMPGAFHTEVVALTDKKLNVYLLDMKFQSPTTVDSSLNITFEGDNSQKAACRKESTYFTCEFSEGVMYSRGELKVIATRNKIRGGVVKYTAPLKY